MSCLEGSGHQWELRAEKISTDEFSCHGSGAFLVHSSISCWELCVGEGQRVSSLVKTPVRCPSQAWFGPVFEEK